VETRNYAGRANLSTGFSFFFLKNEILADGTPRRYPSNERIALANHARRQLEESPWRAACEIARRADAMEQNFDPPGSVFTAPDGRKRQKPG